MSVKWIGLDKLQRKLDSARRDTIDDVAGVLHRKGEEVMTDSKRTYVPVRDGILRDSGHVNLPVVTGNRVSVTLGYGGAAKAYALIQHERLDFAHTRGGPKYLERPVTAAAPEISRAVGEAVERNL